MTDQENLTRLTPARRRLLRRLGLTFTILGVALFSLPFIAILLAIAGILSFMWIPIAFGGALVAMVLLIPGQLMMRAGYVGAAAGIMATETGPAVEYSAAASSRGFARGIAESGILTQVSARTAQVVKVKCRACGYLESEDARFCSQCAKAL